MAQLDDYFDGLDDGRMDAIESPAPRADHSQNDSYFAGYEEGFYAMRPNVDVLVEHGCCAAGHVVQVMMAAHVAYRIAEHQLELPCFMDAVVTALNTGRNEQIERGTPLYDAIERIAVELFEID